MNEPETSLHPDLLGALARLIARAAERSRVVVVTHAARLITALSEQAGCHSIMLEKNFGETMIVGAKSWVCQSGIGRRVRADDAGLY